MFTIVLTLTIICSLINYSFACLDDFDCNHGRCALNTQINASICICDEGWTTFNKDETAFEECNYKQIGNWGAILFSFFLGYTGAPWYYLSQGNALYISLGLIQLFGPCVFAIIIILIGLCVGTCCRDGATGGAIGYSIGCGTCFIPGFAFWLVTLIIMAIGQIPDGNGVALALGEL